MILTGEDIFNAVWDGDDNCRAIRNWMSGEVRA